jgi:putative flippase GtrA
MGIWTGAIGFAKRAFDIGGVRLRFLIVGGINTCFGLSIYPVLMLALRPWHVSYMATLVLSYPIGILFSYTTNKLITFRTKKNYASEIWKFSSFYIVNFLANLAVLPICVEWFHFPPIPVQISFAFIVIALSYLWHSRITFKTPGLVVDEK